MKTSLVSFVTLILLIAGCGTPQPKQQAAVTEPDQAPKSEVTQVYRDDFKKVIDGKQTDLFTLKNDNGIVVQITNYGGRVVSIVTPDKNGEMADIVLGYKTIDKYLKDEMFLGALIGRYANRIANGSFSLDGKKYQLAKNDGPNSLHGGNKGFDKVVWDAEQRGDTLILNYISPDMEEGYPGTLNVTAIYTLNNNNELTLELSAITDKKTIVNLTNHTYWNLKGEGNGTILDHELMIPANYITPVNETLIPTGELMPVEDTPFDFITSKLIGRDISQDHPQLIAGKGYDHNWVLDKDAGNLTLAVRVLEPENGRILEISSTEPGVQFYSGNFMDGSVSGKSGNLYEYRGGMAFEPQHFPDSPNQPKFPSVVLKPGEQYHNTIVYKFDVQK
jgi:aldose 1-epimerase